MKVVVVYTGDVWVRNDDVWEVAQSLDTVGEAHWKEGEGEVGGGKKRFR